MSLRKQAAENSPGRKPGVKHILKMKKPRRGDFADSLNSFVLRHVH